MDYVKPSSNRTFAASLKRLNCNQRKPEETRVRYSAKIVTAVLQDHGSAPRVVDGCYSNPLLVSDVASGIADTLRTCDSNSDSDDLSITLDVKASDIVPSVVIFARDESKSATVIPSSPTSGTAHSAVPAASAEGDPRKPSVSELLQVPDMSWTAEEAREQYSDHQAGISVRRNISNISGKPFALSTPPRSTSTLR